MLSHLDDGPEQLAIGTVRIGARRWRLAPGTQSPRAVAPGAEAMAFVLAGSGVSAGDATTAPIRAGDALLHAPGAAPVLRAGDDGLDVLALGLRAGAASSGGDPASPAPTVVAIADVRGAERDRGEFGATIRNVGVALGSQTTGMRHAEIAPGRLNAPPHCHSAEEELFVVLDGDGALLLYDLDGEATEEHAVRAGHVVARPAGTGISHAFRAGERGMTVLSYGERKGEDVGFYPRSQKLAIRGFGGSGVLGGVVFRVQRADYWDGEA
jgi:uncharacterized cupin superfamily protein